MVSELFRNKRVLVLGKGVSGIAAAKAVEQGGGDAVLYDDYDFTPSSYTQIGYLALSGDCEYDFAVVSPSIEESNPAVKLLRSKGIPVLSEPDLGYLLCSSPIVAVTGTNGKTTVVSMTAHLLQTAGIKGVACGNIGVPFCEVAPTLGKNDVAVVEMSSYQLEQSTRFQADYSAVTNVKVDHLARHGSMQAYFDCKARLTQSTKRGYALNLDERLPVRGDIECYGYSLRRKDCFCYASDGAIFIRDKGSVRKVIDAGDLPVGGDHNLLDAMCALSLCCLYSGYDARFAEGLATYQAEPMRCQRITDTKPYVFNDSKATNLAATISALDTMKGTVALIMGGYDKGESFVDFFASLPAFVSDVVLIGASAERLYSEAEQAQAQDKFVIALDMEAAVRIALSSGADNVLFSPASSSFDHYSGYLERGKDFERIVAKLYS